MNKAARTQIKSVIASLQRKQEETHEPGVSNGIGFAVRELSKIVECDHHDDITSECNGCIGAHIAVFEYTPQL